MSCSPEVVNVGWSVFAAALGGLLIGNMLTLEYTKWRMGRENGACAAVSRR